MICFQELDTQGVDDMSSQVLDSDPVTIEAEPIDELRCLFMISRPVWPERWHYFDSPRDSRGSDLAERIFGLPEVDSVLITHDHLIIKRKQISRLPVMGLIVAGLRRLVGGSDALADEWKPLARRVAARIREHLASGEPAVATPAVRSMPDAATLQLRVQGVLDREVNPVVANHGGGVHLIQLIDNVVYLSLSGGCQGCGLAENTLKHGVEAAIRDAVPEISRIIDLTNHGAGLAPFFKHRRGTCPSRRAVIDSREHSQDDFDNQPDSINRHR